MRYLAASDNLTDAYLIHIVDSLMHRAVLLAVGGSGVLAFRNLCSGVKSKIPSVGNNAG